MSNKFTAVKVSTTTRDIANNLKQGDETLREFFDRIVKRIAAHPDILEGPLKTQPTTDKSDVILEEIHELREGILILREGLKIMVHAASKDNVEIKKVIDHFTKTKNLERA